LKTAQPQGLVPPLADVKKTHSRGPHLADRADHLAIDVDAVLTEHRLGRNRTGAGRLFKQEIDCALLRGHTLNLTDGRRRGQRNDQGLHRRPS
jgi:hypothetical protein